MVSEVIGRISKGTKMDQIYIPKKGTGLEPGEYVVITPLISKINKRDLEKPYFYNIKTIEPLKMILLKEIFSIINSKIKDYENIIITGSFIESGFNFKDIDIIIIINQEFNTGSINEEIEKKLGIKSDILVLNNNSLIHGLNSDPLYQMMLSKCISKKRFLYKIKKEINYKLLDLHLLKSKTLLDNFDIMAGREKYYLTRNLISIKLFLEKDKLSKEIVNKEIEDIFKIHISDIKENIINNSKFIKNYRKLYEELFEKIMEGVKNASK